MPRTNNNNNKRRRNQNRKKAKQSSSASESVSNASADVTDEEQLIKSSKEMGNSTGKIDGHTCTDATAAIDGDGDAKCDGVNEQSSSKYTSVCCYFKILDRSNDNIIYEYELFQPTKVVLMTTKRRIHPSKLMKANYLLTKLTLCHCMTQIVTVNLRIAIWKMKFDRKMWRKITKP